MIPNSAATQRSAGRARRRKEPRFPRVFSVNGRCFVLRSGLEQYKDELQAFALGVSPPEPKSVDPDHFVPLKQVSVELGVGRRTIGRRIKEAEGASRRPIEYPAGLAATAGR
jgi:hypothetical protein